MAIYNPIVCSPIGYNPNGKSENPMEKLWLWSACLLEYGYDHVYQNMGMFTKKRWNITIFNE